MQASKAPPKTARQAPAEPPTEGQAEAPAEPPTEGQAEAPAEPPTEGQAGPGTTPGRDIPGKAGTRPRPGDATQEAGSSEAELAALRRELASTPAAIVIANHCYGLFELAALHLSSQPPKLEEARLAIDSLALLVEGLGNRLGEPAEPLREALTQIRLAFVKIAEAPA